MTLAYANGIPFDAPVIRFYAIVILLGALLALFLSDYRAHKAGFDWHFFDTVFLVAFPSGIVGARIWYVIASWNAEFLPVYQNSGFWAGFGNMFALWNGGLAIQGGAILGIVAGVIYVALRRRGTSVLQIMDFAIPTILVAQAIGRWGNFFNQEVFGHAVTLDAWGFLPTFITNNMQNGTSAMLSGVRLPEGSIAAPLFLVEGVVNLLFFFLLAQGLPALEGKRYVNGDSGFGYFIAYGVVRFVLEPLRNPAFIMGTSDVTSERSGYKSYGMALAFIIIGIVLIIVNHVLDYLAKKNKFDKVLWLKHLYVQELDVVAVDHISEENTSSQGEDDDSIDLSKLKAKEKELQDNN
ncbi:MAG: prolipoprotein diacylglyceryl transferase [Bacilli bacterium]|nr:prolipoprotein diacylglyceryl transferase [Bacilli bacterium]